MLLFSVIVLFGCRNENLFENTNNVKKKNFKISEIKNNEILKDKIIAKEIFKVQKEKFGKSINARSTQDSILDGAKILTENVLLIDNGTQKTYTFPIKRSYVSSKLENLVLKKNADSTFSGTLIQYDLTNEEKALMLSGHFVDLKNKFKIFDINKLSIQSRVATEAYGCYVITWETGVCASGQHAYGGSGCTLTGSDRAGNLSIISIVNTCSGGGSDNGGTYDPNFPNNNDTSGGGSVGSDTSPYDGSMTLPDITGNPDCDKATIPCVSANMLINQINIKPKLDSLANFAATKNIEYAVTVSKPIGETYPTATAPFTQNNPGQVIITAPTNGDYIANAHSHPEGGSPPPSPADFYAAMGNAVNYTTFSTSFIYASDGSVYAIMVNSRQNAQNFLANYPRSSNLSANGQEIIGTSAMAMKFNEIRKNYSSGLYPSYSGNSQKDGLETALAWVLNKYNSGMSIAKMDENGNFKALTAKTFNHYDTAGQQNITAYKTETCP